MSEEEEEEETEEDNKENESVRDRLRVRQPQPLPIMRTKPGATKQVRRKLSVKLISSPYLLGFL